MNLKPAHYISTHLDRVSSKTNTVSCEIDSTPTLYVLWASLDFSLDQYHTLQANLPSLTITLRARHLIAFQPDALQLLRKHSDLVGLTSEFYYISLTGGEPAVI